MRTIVITGATSGFGHMLVRKFLEHGDQVIATGRQLTKRRDLLENERKNFGPLLIEKDLDVTSAEERMSFKTYCQGLPSLDVLINNAGYGLFAALEDASEKQIRQQFEVNFFGLAFLTKDLLPALRKSKGRIFNFSSVFGFVGFPLSGLYCSSKFAVEGLSESLAFELYPHGVQVCLIEPGGYRTKFGNNSFWGDESENPKSAYHRQTENYKTLRDKMMTRPNYQDPQEVADGVYKLSLKKRMPLRVVFGRDGRGIRRLKGLVPQSLFYFFALPLMSRVFTKRPS